MKELRLAVALTGNIHTDPGTQVKLGFLLKALSRQFHIVQVVDANLSGLPRLLNALRVIHPNRRIWQERFIVTYHPAAVLRNKNLMADFVSDLERLNSLQDK